MAAKTKKNSRQTNLTKSATSLEKTIKQVGKKYPELSGRFGVARVKIALTPKRGHSAKRKLRCVQWGFDPVTGKKICLKWE